MKEIHLIANRSLDDFFMRLVEHSIEWAMKRAREFVIADRADEVHDPSWSGQTQGGDTPNE